MSTSVLTPNIAANSVIEIDVAAGALINADGEVLLAQRPAGKHMAGYWEFPGGKFEPNETARDALCRELREELGVEVEAAESLITLSHEYPDRKVRLHIFLVTEWLGIPQSLDKQALHWLLPEQMPAWDLLPADVPIVNALRLPRFYPISPQFAGSDAERWGQAGCWLRQLHTQQVSLFQWRQVPLKHADSHLELRVALWAKAHGMTALLNGCLSDDVLRHAAELGFSGVHLRSKDLQGDVVSIRQAAADLGLKWLAGSCHNRAELAAAKVRGLDFAVLGAVRPTASHRRGSVLGKQHFKELTAVAGLPVYALGGCAVAEYSQFRAMGAQGIAGIRTFADFS